VPDDRKVLEGVDHMVVDGTNVLHALRKSASPLPAAALIGRLRSIVPPGVGVTLVLDGTPEHGLVSRHVASGVEVRYAGRLTADAVIANLVERELYGFAEGLLVITDDIGLAGLVRRAGGRTTRNGWLMDRLDRQKLAAPSVGRPSSPSPTPSDAGSRGGGAGGAGSLGARPSKHRPGGGFRPGSGSGAGTGLGTGPGGQSSPEADSEGPGWMPGRGATKKVGNGKRTPRSSR
jgi:hypothetical protein